MLIGQIPGDTYLAYNLYKNRIDDSFSGLLYVGAGLAIGAIVGAYSFYKIEENRQKRDEKNPPCGIGF